MSSAIATGVLFAIGRNHSPPRQNFWWPSSWQTINACLPRCDRRFQHRQSLHFSVGEFAGCAISILQNRSFAQVTAAWYSSPCSPLASCRSPPSTSRSSRPGYSDFGVTSSVYHRLRMPVCCSCPVVWALSEMTERLKRFALHAFCWRVHF